VHADPYPSIPSALLNAGDIRAYAEHPDTQLFSPFDESKLKPASYEVLFEGDVHSWECSTTSNHPPNRRVEKLGSADTFTIRPNSIVFICPETHFRVPSFLAVRFNLSIKRVHQGLLLGTGPLVDPGFEGRLLIPVHNLTSNEITIRGKDGFIWVEVTKLSPSHVFWDGVAHPHANPVPIFPPAKMNLDATDYFDKANRGLPILSSVEQTLTSVKQALNEGQEMLLKFRQLSVWAGAGLAVSLLIGCGTMVLAAFQLYGIIQTAHGKFDGTTSEVAKIRESDLKTLAAELATIKEELRRLQDKTKVAPVTSKD
jgi:deoxycytidine triphosphate deaminase